MTQTAALSRSSLSRDDQSGLHLNRAAQQAKVPTLISFRAYERDLYDVEVSFQQNGDIIYHFYPKKGSFDFVFRRDVTGMLIEDAFIWAVGPEIAAEADYFDHKTAQHFARASDPSRVLGQPTFYVKAKEAGNRLGAERIMIDRFLGRLDSLFEKARTYVLSGRLSELRRSLKTDRWRD